MSTDSALTGKPSVGGKCFAEVQQVVGSNVSQVDAVPELLAMIFRQVMAQHECAPIITLPTYRHPLSKEHEVNTKPLHIISHVCRYWRQVALGTPALWRRIHGRCHDQLEVFLQRSRPLTATLFLNVEHWGVSWAEPLPAPMVSVVKTHVARLHRLDLSAVPFWEYIAPALTSLQTPHLEVLTITSPLGYYYSSVHTITREPLFHGENRLKALAIMPLVNWMPSCTPFPHLTHLFIVFDRSSGVGHPLDVLQLLSNAPMLVFLHVNALLRQDASYPSDWHLPSEAIPLLCFRSLVFTTCRRKLIHEVLSHILLPEDVFIRLQDLVCEDDSDAYYPPAPIPTISLRPVTSLDVCMDEQNILVVADGPTSGLWFDAHDGVMDPGPVGWQSLLLNLHQCLELSHVTYLHIYLSGTLTFFSGLLSELPQVAHLAVLFGKPAPSTSDVSDVFAHAFSPLAVLCRALSPSTATPVPVLCPALHTLTIEWFGKIDLETIAMFPRIPEMLTARARAGFPIRHVIVHAEPYGLESDAGGPTELDIFRDFALFFNPGDTEYEVVEREDGLCPFEMREMWNIEGEDKYWEVDHFDKAYYVLPFYSI